MDLPVLMERTAPDEDGEHGGDEGSQHESKADVNTDAIRSAESLLAESSAYVSFENAVEACTVRRM